ncbi:MAG: hypothetical protein ACI4OP_05840 [Candidatus Coprovivens sp.]
MPTLNPVITGPIYGINMEPTNAAFLRILPAQLFYSISSESKKSNLLANEPSVVRIFILLRTCLPYTSLPPRVS